MNSIFKNILIGLAAVRANLTRVILTSLGLTIGIFTVSIVTAGVSSIDKEFDKSNLFNVRDGLKDLFNRPSFHQPAIDGVRAIAVLWVLMFLSLIHISEPTRPY